MKMKRIVSGILSGAIALSMAAGLSGCGGSKEDTLTWYMFGDEPADHAMVMEKANEIIEPAIGMKLDMQYIDSASYKEKMKLKMAGGEPFDLLFTGYVYSYQDNVALGGLYDITSLVEELNFSEFIPETFLESAKIDGKIYGIPNVQVISNPKCLMMDQAIADAAGIDMAAIQEASTNLSKTGDYDGLAELLDNAFANLKATKPELYTLNPGYDLFFDQLYEWIIDDSGVAIRKDGSSLKFERAIDTEAYRYSINKKYEWFTKGYVRNDIATAGASLSSKEEKQKVGIVSTTWKPGQDATVISQYGYTSPAVAFIENPYVQRTSALLTMTSVSATSKHPKEAVEFLKLINTNKELYNLICFGIEGTHYNLNEEGKVVKVENSGYDKGSSAWCYGNQFNALLIEGQEDGVWEATEEMNNTATPSPLLGFVPNTENISTELANLATVKAEFGAKVSYGTEDPELWWDDYVKKLEQAGIDKVLAELQAQYDEFLANKN